MFAHWVYARFTQPPRNGKFICELLNSQPAPHARLARQPSQDGEIYSPLDPHLVSGHTRFQPLSVARPNFPLELQSANAASPKFHYLLWPTCNIKFYGLRKILHIQRLFV